MKKYKVRLAGLGIEAVAIIPFDNEPDIEQVQNNIAYYLNNNPRGDIYMSVVTISPKKKSEIKAERGSRSLLLVS